MTPYRTSSELSSETQKNNFFDKLLGKFRFYRKFRGGHWERINVDLLFVETAKPTTPWIRRKKCYGCDFNADISICLLALECEENGIGVITAGNEERWKRAEQNGEAKSFSLQSIPIPPLP